MGIWEGYLDLYKTYNQARQEGINEANFQRDQRVLDTRQERAQNLLDTDVTVGGSMFSQEFDEQGNPINQRLVEQQPRYEKGGFLNTQTDKAGQYSQANKAKLMMGLLDSGYTAPQSANMISLFDTPTDTRTTLQKNFEYNESLPSGEDFVRDKAGNILYERGADGKPLYEKNPDGSDVIGVDGKPVPKKRMKPQAGSQEALDAFRKQTAAQTNISNQISAFKNPQGTSVEQDEQGNPIVVYAPGTKEHNEATGKIRATEDAIGAVQQMRDLIAEHGSEIAGPISGQMGQVYGQVLAEVAKARDMGVLQAGELEMIQSQLTDPSSFRGAATMKSTMMAQYEQLWTFLLQRYKRYGSEFKNMKIGSELKIHKMQDGKVTEMPNPYNVARGQEEVGGLLPGETNTSGPTAPPIPDGFQRR